MLACVLRDEDAKMTVRGEKLLRLDQRPASHTVLGESSDVEDTLHQTGLRSHPNYRQIQGEHGTKNEID